MIGQTKLEDIARTTTYNGQSSDVGDSSFYYRTTYDTRVIPPPPPPHPGTTAAYCSTMRAGLVPAAADTADVGVLCGPPSPTTTIQTAAAVGVTQLRHHHRAATPSPSHQPCDIVRGAS